MRSSREKILAITHYVSLILSDRGAVHSSCFIDRGIFDAFTQSTKSYYKRYQANRQTDRRTDERCGPRITLNVSVEKYSFGKREKLIAKEEEKDEEESDQRSLTTP